MQRMQKIKFKKFNIKALKKINLKYAICILIITTELALFTSTAKFGETLGSNDSAIVAMPIFSSTTINLEDIYPDMETKEYTLEISNTKDKNTSQVSLDYTVEVEDSGNVPLDIKLYKIEDEIVVGDNLLTDGTTQEITMYVEDTVHKYSLQISWDKTISDYANYKYSNEISVVKLNTQALQKD